MVNSSSNRRLAIHQRHFPIVDLFRIAAPVSSLENPHSKFKTVRGWRAALQRHAALRTLSHIAPPLKRVPLSADRIEHAMDDRCAAG